MEAGTNADKAFLVNQGLVHYKNPNPTAGRRQSLIKYGIFDDATGERLLCCKRFMDEVCGCINVQNLLTALFGHSNDREILPYEATVKLIKKGEYKIIRKKENKRKKEISSSSSDDSSGDNADTPARGSTQKKKKQQKK
jgi:hypothetical protein